MIKNDASDQDHAELQNARDNVLAEFFKEKQQAYLTKKRKIFVNDSTEQQQQEDTISIELSPETKARLKEVHEKFFSCLDQRDFHGLTPVIQFLRERIADREDPIPGGVISEMGIIPHLLEFLSDNFADRKEFQIEIAWLLANIAAGCSKDAQTLVEMNIIPVMAQAMRSSINDDLEENIMWALANIAGESDLSYRDQMLEHGILRMVVKNLANRPYKIAYYRTAAWLISNLVRGHPSPPFEQVERVFGALTHLINYPDDIIQQHTLVSLTYLSEEANENHIRSFVNHSLIPKIVQYVSRKEEQIAINAIKVAGNLAKGNKQLVHNLCDYELFKALPTILESSNAELRRSACIMLSNILSNEFDDHDYIEDYGSLEVLIKLAQEDPNIDIRAQATFCLQKFLDSATNEYAMIAIERGAVEVFLQNLQSTDVKLTENSLQAFYKTLEHGENMRDKNGGINFIASKIIENGLQQVVENLQTHPSEDIALKPDLIYQRFLSNL